MSLSGVVLEYGCWAGRRSDLMIIRVLWLVVHDACNAEGRDLRLRWKKERQAKQEERIDTVVK